MESNDSRVVPPLPFTVAVELVAESEADLEAMVNEFHDDNANSAVSRLSLHRAKHNRELAAIHATLAVAEELRQTRHLLAAWITQCTQAVI